MKLNAVIALFFLFTTLTMKAQEDLYSDLKKDWITEDLRANFGTVTDLYEDSLGIIWMNIFGKGLAYYDGQKIQRVRIPEEVKFANASKVLHGHQNKIYLNCKSKVLVFDPIARKVVDEIFFESSSNQIIGELCIIPKLNEAHIVAIIETNTTNDQVLYQLYHSRNSAPLSLVRSEVFQTEGSALIKAVDSSSIILKSDKGLILYDLDTNDQISFWENELDLVNLNSRNLHIHDDALLTNTLLKDADQKYNFSISKLSLDNTSRSLETLFNYSSYRGSDFNILDNYLIVKDHIFNFQESDDAIYHDEMISPVVLQNKSGLLFTGGIFGLAKFRNKQTVFHKVGPISGRQMNELPDGKIVGTVGYNPKDITTIIYDPKKNISYQSTIFKSTKTNAYQAPISGNFLYRPADKVDIQSGDVTRMPLIMEDFKRPPMLTMIDQDGQLWKTNWKEDIIAIYNSSSGGRLVKTKIEALTKNPVVINDWYQRPSNGNVWMGTAGQGIFIFNNDGELLRQLQRDLSTALPLSSNNVSGFYEDSKGKMWITHGAGISMITKEGSQIEHFALDPLDPESRIFYSILPEDDDRYLWLSSSKGIFRFDTEEKSFMDFPLEVDIMNFEYNRTSFLKAKNGRMYFGTSGTNSPTIAFYPSEVLNKYQNLADSKAAISLSQLHTSYSSEKKDMKLYDGLDKLDAFTFDNDLKSFSFNYLLTDFRIPEQIQYTHRLIGYEDDWTSYQKSKGTARYENLDDGEYQLQFAASIQPTSEKTMLKSITITILPDWYETWWAWLLFFLAGLGIIALTYRYNLRRQAAKLEQKRLHDLDEIKTRLYTNITHEFRTPLTVILGMNDNIQGHESEKSLIKKNAQGLLGLINQILDLSKLKSGELQLNLVKEDIVSYVQYLIESFFSMATAKRITLTFEAEHGQIAAKYDKNKLQHIVYNLVSNAVKFTKSGGKVHVHLRVKENNMILSIKDTGIGIDEEQLPKIFERYYQAHSPNNDAEKVEGSGIGLAYTKELIEHLGGSISVSSKLNWGSEFIVTLPSQNINTSQQPLKIQNTITPKTPEVLLQPQETTSSEKPLILLVEDNEDVAIYVQSILKNNYTVRWAINGQEGIDVAVAHIPDLIISDIMMPEKDGFEVVQTLKKDLRTSHIPFIMLTAKADFDSKIEGLALGAEAYLTKPFEKEELLIRVEKLLTLRVQLQAYYSGQAPISDQEAEVQPQSREQQFIGDLIAYIHEHISDSDLSVHSLAKTAGMSHTQVYRKLKAITGITPILFIRKQRLEKAHDLLKTTDLHVSEVAYKVGFNDPSYFTRVFKKEYGVVPGDLK